MKRLMDIGLERLSDLVFEMAALSDRTVMIAIEAYTQGKDLRDGIFGKSEQLRILQDDVNDLATELLARYQPVASDLRFITSCMEIAYGFSRFGRYAYDISDLLVIYGDLTACDKTEVVRAGNQAKEMIQLSIKALTARNVELAKLLRDMDDTVDRIYRNFIRQIVNKPVDDFRCIISATLVLRYLERIADHATYIGDTVIYIKTGEQVQRVKSLESSVVGG